MRAALDCAVFSLLSSVISYKLHFPTPHPSLSLTAFFFALWLITLKLQLFSKLELKLNKLSEGGSPWEVEQLQSFFLDQSGTQFVQPQLELE